MELKIKDVRAEMPNYEHYKDWQRPGPILGIAVHHSATADWSTGAPTGNAQTFFEYDVGQRGWAHGGYNYVITGQGEIEYALDEQIAAYHAGFTDPDNSEGLEYGQYWDNHYLAICLAGWFEENRLYRDPAGHIHTIPNAYTSPTDSQMQALVGLIQQLRQKYDISVENVRGHRELAGNTTTCPGQNLDPAELRARLRAANEVQAEGGIQAEPVTPVEVETGEHVLLLPDADKYLIAAMAYIWKFQPDVSFAVDEARGRWKYVTVVGNKEHISDEQLARLRSGGAALVQRIPGDPQTVQQTLDELTQLDLRFSTAAASTEAEEQEWRTYIVQPGDTLSFIARQVYGEAQSWRAIFEANYEVLGDPSQVHPGQVLKIPAKPML